MLLCLPLFLGFAAEAQAQAECVSEDLLDHVEAKIEIKPTDRWVRIKNALTEQSNAMPLSEAKSILANRKANGWNLNRFDDVVAAMECLAKPKPGGLEADDASQSCVSPELQADVKGYSEETWHGSAHVERWLRVLQTFSGTANDSTVMTPAEAQEMADRWSNGRWDPVVDALQCLETETLNEQVEVQEPEPEPLNIEDTVEPEDTPQPLNAEETPMPAQSDPVRFTTFRVYVHDATPNPNPGTEYRISEDDHWEAELILHFETNRSNVLSEELCVNYDYWSGNEHWNNGPIALGGFDGYFEFLFLEGLSVKYGRWRCTPDINSDPTPPNITILNPADDGDDDDASNDDGIIEFIYRGKIRIRDNNVVEDDFSIVDSLKFRYSDGVSGSTIWRTETDEIRDRSWWRMLEDEVAWPGNWSLGTGGAWHDFTNPTCGEVAPSKWIDRAPANRDKTHADYIVRANVDADVWLPDHCFPVKHVPKIPPTPPNTQPTTHDNTSLPIIEEDDVSWFDLEKIDGKWIVSISKPIMVTDDEGDYDRWWKTPDGLVLTVNFTYTAGNNLLRSDIPAWIPAVNGIVQDGDYVLHELNKVTPQDIGKLTSDPTLEYQLTGKWLDNCTTPLENSLPTTIESFVPTASELGVGYGFEVSYPANADLCR